MIEDLRASRINQMRAYLLCCLLARSHLQFILFPILFFLFNSYCMNVLSFGINARVFDIYTLVRLSCLHQIMIVPNGIQLYYPILHSLQLTFYWSF